MALSLIAVLLPWSSRAQSSGQITGRVTLSAAIASRKMRFRLYADLGPGAVAKRATADSNEMANVVIYLEGLRGNPAASGSAGVITQREEVFSPHVLPVVTGATVEFRNEDDYFHNVFSLAKAKQFDLGRFPKGQSKSVRFDKPGIVQVFCHIHADMSAVVLVLDHGWFGVPDAQGDYHIDGVPPGEYRLVAWHERARRVTRAVRVVAGESTVLDVSIPITDELAARP